MEALEKILNLGIGSLTLSILLSAAVLALACLLVIKLLLRMFDRVTARTKIDPTLLGMLRAGIKALLLFITVLIVMGHLNIPVTSLVAVLSVVGVAVSLGVQNFLGNVVGGLQLLASRPFKEGDFVEAGGCSGTVKEVGLFYTKLTTPDNKLVQLPNSTVVSANITNYSYEELRRVDLKITVSYEAPVERVKDSLLASARSIPTVLDEPAPMARLNSYQSSVIEYILRVWCRNGDYWDTYFDLNEAVKTGFDRDGIEMTYDHLNVHITEQ